MDVFFVVLEPLFYFWSSWPRTGQFRPSDTQNKWKWEPHRTWRSQRDLSWPRVENRKRVPQLWRLKTQRWFSTRGGLFRSTCATIQPENLDHFFNYNRKTDVPNNSYMHRVGRLPKYFELFSLEILFYPRRRNYARNLNSWFDIAFFHWPKQRESMM